MPRIGICIKSEKKQVVEFLLELHRIVDSKDFDLNKHFFLSRKPKEEMCFSTKFAMADLDYDNSDVIERLRELTVADYSQTLFDRDDDNPPLLFVFGKSINGREVYIKLKIRGEETKRILCVSFHYAKYKMNYPYA